LVILSCYNSIWKRSVVHEVNDLVKITKEEFFAHKPGVLFKDLERESPEVVTNAFHFLNDCKRQDKLECFVVYKTKLTALAGVVRELEQEEWFISFVQNSIIIKRNRLKQLIGLMIKQIMKQRGFETTGKKGLFTKPTLLETYDLTDVNNVKKLSIWFTSAALYIKVDK
jgi:hypothetical protein